MALRFALDTNRYRDFCTGDRDVLDRVQLAERIFLSFVTRSRVVPRRRLFELDDVRAERRLRHLGQVALDRASGHVPARL